MKNILLTLLTLIANISFSQGIIINEISNGTSGTKEFIEFLVIGSSTQPTGLVDITHWVFDDNNGDFEASTGAGVAAGHYRFTNLTPLIPIGSLIIVYNNADINLNMISDDPLDSNNDFVYVFPINSIYLEKCTGSPSSTIGTTYTPCTYTSSSTQTWTSIGLRNGGDAAQIRKPDYSFYHGFSYGDVLNIYPTFPNGNTSFNVITGSGTAKNYYLDCGDWTEKSNYYRGDANFDTPGLPNTYENQNLITNIRIGSFDYDNLSEPYNCFPIILDESSIGFRAKRLGKNVEINWDTLTEIKDYILEKSYNGYDFKEVYQGELNIYIDNLDMDNYYRLKLVDFSDNFIYTNTIYIKGDKVAEIQIYPTLVHSFIRIETELEGVTCYIYTTTGQELISIKPNNNILKLDNLPSGIYFLRIETKEYHKVLKFQKI